MEQAISEVIANSPYSEWLEDLVKTVYELKPTAIGAVLLTEDGSSLTAYYESGWADKLLMSGAIQTDAMITAVKASREEIEAAWEDEDEEEDGELDDG